MDNHDSHISLSAINLAREAGIVLLTIPPHTSHKTQPLDRTVFGPYKTYFNKAANEWMLANPGKPITIYNIAQIVGKAYPQAFGQQNIIKGFEVTGIHPLNENIFTDDEFLSSFVTDRPFSDEPHNEVTQGAEPHNMEASNLPGPFNSQVLASSPRFITPEAITPFPKAAPRQQNICRGKKKGKTRILTDTPEKDAIMSATVKMSIPKKRKAVKKEF